MSEVEILTERLELRGHRVTQARKRVIRALLNAPNHFTIDHVLQGGEHVGRATVFRTMKILLDMNVVCRVLMEDGAIQYRLSSRGHHHHLVCRSCERVEDFATCDVASLVEELTRDTDYQIEGHWLEVYGTCAACRLLEPNA